MFFINPVHCVVYKFALVEYMAFTGGVQRYEKLSALLSDEYLPVYPVPERLEALHGVSVMHTLGMFFINPVHCVVYKFALVEYNQGILIQ